MKSLTNCSLGRRFNGLHDYLFRLYENNNEIGSFALTNQQFKKATSGEEILTECRFGEDSTSPTRQILFSLKNHEAGWKILLSLTRKSYTISLSETQLTNLQNRYGTEPVEITEKKTTGESSPLLRK